MTDIRYLVTRNVFIDVFVVFIGGGPTGFPGGHGFPGGGGYGGNRGFNFTFG